MVCELNTLYRFSIVSCKHTIIYHCHPLSNRAALAHKQHEPYIIIHAAPLLTPDHYPSVNTIQVPYKMYTLDDKIVARPRQDCMATKHLQLLVVVAIVCICVYSVYSCRGFWPTVPTVVCTLLWLCGSSVEENTPH